MKAESGGDRVEPQNREEEEGETDPGVSRHLAPVQRPRRHGRLRLLRQGLPSLLGHIRLDRKVLHRRHSVGHRHLFDSITYIHSNIWCSYLVLLVDDVEQGELDDDGHEVPSCNEEGAGRVTQEVKQHSQSCRCKDEACEVNGPEH